MSLSSKKCCVPSCMDSGGMEKPLHLFPNPEKDKQRFNEWVFFIGGDIIGMDNDDIYKHRRVCHAHFEEKFCHRFKRLSDIAIPTLKLPGPTSVPKFTMIDQRRPLHHISPAISKVGDHLSDHYYFLPNAPESDILVETTVTAKGDHTYHLVESQVPDTLGSGPEPMETVTHTSEPAVMQPMFVKTTGIVDQYYFSLPFSKQSLRTIVLIPTMLLYHYLTFKILP